MTREDIEALIELALPYLGEYGDPEVADGHCGLATDEFFNIIDELLPDKLYIEAHFSNRSRQNPRPTPKCVGEIWDFHYDDPDHHWYDGGCKWEGHVVALIGGWFIDWTARQFREDAPFPLVFRIEGFDEQARCNGSRLDSIP